MPEPGTELKFKNWKFCTRAPFVIYADLESVLAKHNKQTGASRLYQHHKPCAASALLVSTVPTFDNQFCIFTGQDAVKKFLDKLIEWEEKAIEHLEHNIPMRTLSKKQVEAHRQATTCCICHNPQRPFIGGDGNWQKVHDHDHVTGYYIGAAHDLCNRRRRVVYEIPVFLHNFRGYDSHLIVQSFKHYQNREIKVIGQNLERYIQVKWGPNLVFKDSLMFLSSSLDSLVESLRKTDPAKFERLETLIPSLYPNTDPKLLLRKGVFPYEYLDSFEKLNDGQLPPREAFASSLAGKECSEDDYRYAQQVCQITYITVKSRFLYLFLFVS